MIDRDAVGADDSNTEDDGVLLHETSPDGSVHAVVEQDDRTTYLYLHSPLPGFETRACWVRNLVAGPAALDRSEMNEGLAPRLPRLACRHPKGAEPLRAEDLEIVWFETGDGAALYENGEMLAAIPPWSGEAGFHGYARDCREESELCWPMPLEPEFFARMAQARAWWKRWKEYPVWPERQEGLLKSYEQRFGKHQAYFAIDGERWPPKGLASFSNANISDLHQTQLLLTVGVSLRPMPGVERYTDAPQEIDRVEFGAWSAAGSMSRTVANWLSGVANYPWHYRTWLGAGHTMKLPEKQAPSALDPRAAGLRDNAQAVNIVWVDSRRFPLPLGAIELPEVDQCPTRLLIALPISAAETALIRAGGAEAVLASRMKEPASWALVLGADQDDD